MDVLRDMDRVTYSLEMVAPPPEERKAEEEEEEEEEEEDDEDADLYEDAEPARPRHIIAGPPAAICRIIDRAAAAAAAYEAKKAARQKAVNTKELELNWAIAPNDLAHKTRRLREFLGKGMQVEVMLANRRHGRVAARAESEAVLAAVREAALAVPGAKESKRMDGEVGGVVRVFFDGPSGKERKRLAAQAAEAAERAEATEGTAQVAEGAQKVPGQEE